MLQFDEMESVKLGLSKIWLLFKRVRSINLEIQEDNFKIIESGVALAELNSNQKVLDRLMSLCELAAIELVEVKTIE